MSKVGAGYDNRLDNIFVFFFRCGAGGGFFVLVARGGWQAPELWCFCHLPWLVLFIVRLVGFGFVFLSLATAFFCAFSAVTFSRFLLPVRRFLSVRLRRWLFLFLLVY
ncbi:hypothetical protein WN982_06800 [Paraburkholderia sp. IMGN_8]|uniref:hypothetical protein n=1 Tax=Paraburkholderia sp. IMGN_8 TaxID=3136564 RepID=UPI003100F55F